MGMQQVIAKDSAIRLHQRVYLHICIAKSASNKTEAVIWFLNARRARALSRAGGVPRCGARRSLRRHGLADGL